ncbi:MAG TPA: gliding motility-associated C-terminal domain-containing protein, partial [Ohtaekwangia sp.]|nr:gliding motility-associated C-terminal domain-containing protein [Ohtaekwangia sp.]
CEGTEATITLTGVSNATSFNWAVPAGVTILFQSDASVRIRATSGPGGAVSATPSNECGAGSQTNGNITVIPAPSLAIDLPASPFTDVPVQFTFSSSATIANASWNFGDGGTANGLVVEHAYSESGSYNIALTATADNGCENSASSPFVVLDEPELGDLSIKNVITANGDESNAYLHIVNIDRYPDNEVRFLDRWGVEVFSAKGYNNDWDARSKHGDFLPAGQYICIVKLNSTGKVFSRTVSIIKSR